MDKAIKVRCPNLQCRLILSVPSAMRGQSVRCATCGEMFRVPDKPRRKTIPFETTARPGGRG